VRSKKWERGKKEREKEQKGVKNNIITLTIPGVHRRNSCWHECSTQGHLPISLMNHLTRCCPKCAAMRESTWVSTSSTCTTDTGAGSPLGRSKVRKKV